MLHEMVKTRLLAVASRKGWAIPGYVLIGLAAVVLLLEVAGDISAVAWIRSLFTAQSKDVPSMDAGLAIHVAHPVLGSVAFWMFISGLIWLGVLAFVPTIKRAPAIDGEIYRVATAPKTPFFSAVESLFEVMGHPEQATIDHDILMELYLVNKSKETRYIREVLASVEIDGKKVSLQRKNDFHAFECNGDDYEYALNMGGSKFDRGEKQALPNLAAALNKTPMKPGEPLEGWLRFELKGVLREKIEDNRTYEVVIVDSGGKDYTITKASTLKREGEVDVRRQQAP